MPVLAPPPPVNQDINTRQYKDWFYTIYQSVSGAGGDLGTMASQNANNVAITGGAIGGVGITGSNINNTAIGQLVPAAGKFTTLESSGSLKTDTLTGYLFGHGSGGIVTSSSTIPNTDITGLGTMATQNIGVSGTFKSADIPQKTITVTNGIITSIV